MSGCIILTVLIASAINASAQKAVVDSVFSKHGLDQFILDPANFRLPVDHAFDLKESTITAGTTKVIEAKFDPSHPPKDQWTVVSVDGKSPSLYESNTFRNTKAKQAVDKPDDKTYKIESESADKLVISYKLEAKSIPRETDFLKDCRVYMAIDLKTKHLSQLQLLNEKPVKVGPLQAKKFELVTKYTYNETTKRYLPASDNLILDAEFLKKAVTTQIKTEYSNYIKK